MKALTILAVLFLTQNSLAKTKHYTKTATLRPLTTQTTEPLNIAAGLKKLGLADNERAELLKKAVEFEIEVRSTIANKLAESNQITYSYSETTELANFVVYREITIPSLIQREPGHPANNIKLHLYLPNSPNYCDQQLPSTLLLHHIADVIEAEKRLSKFMALQIPFINNGIAAAAIELPFYGQRKIPGSQQSFLSPNPEDFRKNMLQLVLDVHLARIVMESIGGIDPGQITLSGLSLGGVLGYVVAAHNDPFPGGYGFIVGGGNLPSVLANRIKTRPNSEVAQIYGSLFTTEEDVKKQIGYLDPITWAHKIDNSRVFAIVASKDDIVDYQKSVQPLKELLTENNNNQWLEKVNDDTHSPTGSSLELLKKLLLPIVKFVESGSKKTHTYCEQPSF